MRTGNDIFKTLGVIGKLKFQTVSLEAVGDLRLILKTQNPHSLPIGKHG